MHDTALEYGNLFFQTYIQDRKSIKILDLGSQDINGTLRVVAPEKAEYIGVDFIEGKGVDVRITDSYILPFENNSIDVIVSSSCFEHSEFFWLSFIELMRVLKPTGLLYINAPSNGSFHRYPLDCWRFYPDSGIALEHWAHKNNYENTCLLESFVGTQKLDLWNDFVAVFIKDKTYHTKYKNRMLHNISEYTNAHLFGNEKILNFTESSFDQIKVSQQVNKIKDLEKKIMNLEELNKRESLKFWELKKLHENNETLIYEFLSSKSWKITKPLREVRRILDKLIKFRN